MKIPLYLYGMFVFVACNQTPAPRSLKQPSDRTAIEKVQQDYDSLRSILSALQNEQQYQRLWHIPAMEKIFAASKTCIDTSNEYYGKIRFTLGKLYCDKDSNVAVGTSLYQDVFIFRNQEKPLNQEALYAVSYNLSLRMNQYGSYEAAIQYADTALSMALQLKAPDKAANARLEKANALCYMRDYRSAHIQAKIALDSFETIKDTIKIANIHNLLGNIHLGINELDNAIRHYHQAQQFYQQANDSDGMAHPLHNLGILYRRKQRYDSSDICLNQARAIWKEGKDTLKYANTILELGHTQAAQNHTLQAFQAYKNALALFGNRKHPYKTECYKGLGDLHLKANQLDSALFAYEAGIQASILDNNRRDTIKLPELLVILAAKAKVLVLKKQIPMALKTYYSCDELIEHLQRFYRSDASKFLLSEKAKEIYTAAIELAYCTNDKPAYLRFLKNSKSVVLRQILMNAHAKAALPDALLQQEAMLRMNIASFQYLLTKHPHTESVIQEYSDSIMYAQNNLNQFIINIEKNYPKYYELKWKPNPTLTMRDVQRKLSNDQILMEYFLSDTAVYSLGLTQNAHHITKTLLPKTFTSIVNRYRQVSFQLETNIDTYNELSEKAYILYQLLLEKPLSALNADQQKNRLLLIPDDILNTIAFDNLATRRFKPIYKLPSEWESNDKAILLNQYATTYNFAHDIYAQYYATARTSQFFGTFMPDYTKIRDNSIQKLANVQDLILRLQKIERFKGGTFHTLDNTSKQDFLKDAKHYKILFLSMHGKANDQNPAESGLLFVKKDTLIELLTISEISAMQLEGNELIVLSACETGKGQLQKGEGIISLSRAFAMSGSKSLILSLSEVDELAASHIMVAFLTNIQQGMLKDVALQQAKMDYVKHHPYHYMSAPGHWAPFILLGDNSAVPTSTHYGWVVLCILIGIMVLYGVTKGRRL